jgi:hypothetical protein
MPSDWWSFRIRSWCQEERRPRSNRADVFVKRTAKETEYSGIVHIYEQRDLEVVASGRRGRYR